MQKEGDVDVVSVTGAAAAAGAKVRAGPPGGAFEGTEPLDDDDVEEEEKEEEEKEEEEEGGEEVIAALNIGSFLPSWSASKGVNVNLFCSFSSLAFSRAFSAINFVRSHSICSAALPRLTISIANFLEPEAPTQQVDLDEPEEEETKARGGEEERDGARVRGLDELSAAPVTVVAVVAGLLAALSFPLNGLFAPILPLRFS